jgi:hypothetical protein
LINRCLARIHLLKSISPQDSRPHYGRVRRLLTTMTKIVFSPVPIHGVRRVHQILNSIVPYSKAQTLCNPIGTYSLREYFPRSWFAEWKHVSFGHLRARVPIGVEPMLRSLYGSGFMQPVSPQAQTRAHECFQTLIAPRLPNSVKTLGK